MTWYAAVCMHVDACAVVSDIPMPREDTARCECKQVHLRCVFVCVFARA